MEQAIHQHRGELYSILCAAVWAVAVILFRRSGERVGPIPLNLFKNTLALGLFLLTLLGLGMPLFGAEHTRREWLTLLLSGAMGIGLGDCLFFASLNRLGAGRSAIVDCVYSPFVFLCSFVYLHEPLTLNVLLALAVMIAALFLGTWNPGCRPSPSCATERRTLLHGTLLGVMAMFFTAVGIVCAKPVLDRVDPLWATTVRLIGGMLPLAAIGMGRAHRQEALRCFRPGRLWWVAVPACFLGTYLGMFLWILGVKYTYTTTASVLNQTSAIFTLILATVFLKEALTWRKVGAIVLGLAGGALSAL